ncbi:uncharacterized protein LOC120836893 [Ixodes scapularis]|uniref:uncharacterized protein LOC120836893 n=1 Tax=Ixodes scapularis TaxID=6945 RepID=UPI001A9E44EC|nr:uncharacterized protein LOC120836893 [Ixodes scapularis]
MATESKKQRRPNFTEAELETLVDGYEARRTAIDAKGDGPHGSAAKQRAWLQITKDLYAVSGVRRDVAEVKKKWADYKSIHKKRGASLKRSQGTTGGGVGDKPLNDVEERMVGLLSVEAMAGIPGAFDIGVAVEVPMDEPFSLPFLGTPATSQAARPGSVELVPSIDTTPGPCRPASSRPPRASLFGVQRVHPQEDAENHDASGCLLQDDGGASLRTSRSHKPNQRRDMEDPSHKIIESQQAIVERLDQIIELQKQRVALEAYKLNVQFVDGKIVPM